MGKIISIVNSLTVAAGTSNTISVYRPVGGKKAVVRKVKVYFPVGTENMLQVAIYHGIAQVIPKQGVISGDGCWVEVEADEEYISDEEIKLWYNNTDTVNNHTMVYVLIIELI